MAEPLATGRKTKVPSTAAVGSKFDRYKPEEEKEVRKLDIKEDEVLKQLKAVWKKFEAPVTTLDQDHENAVKQLRGVCYSAKDVENFSIALAEFQDERYFSYKAGVFLSALINNGKDSDYVIHTQHLKEVSELGYKNTKKIVVNGHVCGPGPFMEGGTIIVNGNAGPDVGAFMRGGTIIVNGNAGDKVGDGMLGGEIHIEGHYKKLSYIYGGKIYHKGVLVAQVREADSEQTETQFRLPKLEVAKHFGAYGPETERDVRKIDVHPDEVLEQLKKAWQEGAPKCAASEKWKYDEFTSIVKSLNYSAKDVENFTIVLSEFQEWEFFPGNAGLFLSALINNGSDSDYILPIAHLPRLNLLAFKNCKNITVLGDIGPDFAAMMTAGKITIKGDAGDCLGSCMKGGEMTVEGNAGDNVGDDMTDGTILVKGNAEHFTGGGMTGGKITIEGNAGEALGSTMKGGSILVKGNVRSVYGIMGGRIVIEGNTCCEGLSMPEMYGGELHINGEIIFGLRDLEGWVKEGKIYHKGKLIVDK